MGLKQSNGGFAAFKSNSNTISELVYVLKNEGFETVSFQNDNLLLASKRQFFGQGLWRNSKGCVAYDVDLTNKAELLSLMGASSGKSDTGTLLWGLYGKYGLDFVDRLRGAFAFALWDNSAKKLIVVTDPYGIRPVVYSQKNNIYCAASRIRTLRLGINHDLEINPEAVYHYLFSQAICSPISIYKGVNKLEPGKGHIYFQEVLKEFRHYDIRYNPKNSVPEEEWCSSIFQEVKKSVAKFLPLSSPEKTGCFLSGGTDSSTIAGLVTELSGRAANTFSIGFDDPAYSELGYAEIAANAFGTNQHEYIVTPEDTLKLIHQIPYIYDEPFGNASVVAAYYCALSAKENGIDVLLGGDGGDEIFGGNERYVTNLVFSRYHRIPEWLRKGGLEPLINLLPDIGVLHKASRYIRRANFPNPYRFYSYNLLAEKPDNEVWTSDFLEQMNPDCFMEIARNHYENAAPAHDTDRLLYLDMKFTITDNDLRKVTQMAESAGIRVRYPYLDRDLVDFTATIPPTLKVKYGRNRYIFKRAMENFLPKEIIHKSKHGMGLPISNWFRTEKILSELLFDKLFTGVPVIFDYVKPTFLNSLYQSFKEDENTSYYGDMLWVYLILELWLKKEKKKA
ncbi:asparagine synthase-related protein [Desulfobacter postgatei]|uniref:asparagine synthetase B family protein n=1 Tax=Desulfobacter postgatei TaxID=2293 RepID=UPI00259B85D3|nr:asparagine synthase-related protein [uncultured Desulfobacter sp.]